MGDAAGAKERALNSFGVLQLFGALMVMYRHQFVLMGMPGPAYMGSLAAGMAGVKVIFVGSGYLITKSFERDPHFGRYMRKRLVRLYPPFIASLLFSVLIVGPLMTNIPIAAYIPGAFRYVRDNLLMNPMFALPGVFTDNPYPNAVNGSYWTMPLVVVLYVVIAAVTWLLLKIKSQKVRTAVSGLVAAAFMAGYWAQTRLLPADYRMIVWGTDWVSTAVWSAVPYYLIGSFVAVSGWEKYFNLPAAALIAVFASGIKYRGMDLVAMPVVSYLILSLCFCETPFLSAWVKKHPISYGVYLYGFVVQQILLQLLWVRAGIQVSPNIYFAASLVLTVALSLVSCHLVEKPSTRWLNGLWKKEKE
ncbi:MAG: acyltransferase [Lachnospiraceae bacterium]|nr:acyltransferase [Lachnospiraceae bacterium]